MIVQGQLAWAKEASYCWLASFLSLWLTVAYLWMAFFYPLMCAPYSSNGGSLDQTTAFEHTITPFSVVMSIPVAWPLYFDMNTSSNSSWLLDSHDEITGLALTFINVMAMPAVSWLNPIQPIHTVGFLQPELYKQIRISPPEQPPRLFPA